ncbi:MAG: flagellar hook-basal body complex protein FliE [Chloroflexi bacterium]|nr:flagellar hook-basal body complex protein FliE [Chloroflexota bacterium]MBV9897069.1 flagellar hook-basal body complex protein FliE [Chloroflexota bacterium]
MPISSITGGMSPLTPSLPSSGASGTKPAGADFGNALKQAVSSLQQLGGQADSASLSLAKGDPIDIHEVMIANEQASLGFSMAVQVRNKLVDAYSEIMRMSV